MTIEPSTLMVAGMLGIVYPRVGFAMIWALATIATIAQLMGIKP